MNFPRVTWLSATCAVVAIGLTGCAASTNPAGAESGPPGVTVQIIPTQASSPPSGQVQFAAVVTGAATSAVTWAVTEGTAGGTVDASGHYTAPGSTGVFHVVVTSQADTSKSATAQVTVATLTGQDILPADRRTLWQPGVTYNGGIPAARAKFVVPSGTHGADATGTIQPTGVRATDQANVQWAITNCPANQYVQLGPGTFMINGLSMSRSNITLRGTLDANGNLLTKLWGNNSDWIISFNGYTSYSTPRNLSQSEAKGSTTIHLASGGSDFTVGSQIVLDQADDPSIVFTGMDDTDLAQHFKRSPGGSDIGPLAPGANIAANERGMAQVSEVTGVNGNVITLATPLHRNLDIAFAPQAWRSSATITRWSGVEDLYLTGGSVAMVRMADSAYCWVKHVESDGSLTTDTSTSTYGASTRTGNGFSGDHFEVVRCFRCEIRDSYIHDAHNGGSGIIQGGGAYGISLYFTTADSLVENNIIFNLNKPFTCRGSGGGNVVGYNYIDDAWTHADGAKMEQAIDFGHSSFPHDELYEGNWVSQIGSDNVWGNSGWNVAFRNWATGLNKRSAVSNPKNSCYEIQAVNIQSRSHSNSFIGNVIGVSGAGQVYEIHGSGGSGAMAGVNDKWILWTIGNGTGGGNGDYNMNGFDAYPWQPTANGNPGAGYTLLRVGNWDYARNQIDADPGTAVPDSLYLVGKPAFFGSNTWPWVTPEGATKTAVLPAKARYDAGMPMMQ
jgi:hypothetical protein